MWSAPGFLLFLLLTPVGAGWAATYTLPGGPLPTGCTASDAVVTCPAPVVLNNNDQVVITAPPAVTWNVGGLDADHNNILINANRDASYLKIVSSGPITIQNGVVINANIEAVGNIEIKNNGSLTGDITGQANVIIGQNAVIYGNITAGGNVSIGNNAVVIGNINAVGVINIGANAEISGACLEINMTTPDPACNTTISSLHHLRIEHDGEGLTCLPESVTVRACMDATCSSEYAVGSVTATLSPTGWTNGDIINFSAHTTASLVRTVAGSVTLGASNISPTPTSGIRCFVGGVENCTLNFVDTGFIFSAAANGPEAEVGPQVAGTAFGPHWLRAIKTNDKTKACESALSAPQTVNFYYVCADPVACSSGNQMTIGGSAVGAGATPLSLSFDGNGNASLGNINYLDVGKITLKATATVGGATLTGTLGGLGGSSFIVKPYGFLLNTTCADGTANGASQTTPATTDPKFCRAGQDFTTTVTAINQAGNATPNYGRESSPETVAINWARQLPDPGIDGSLPSGAPAYTSNGMFGPRTYTGGWDEVGILRAVVSVGDSDYLGAGNVSSTAYVGRFFPHHFKVDIAPQCGDFVYSGRPGGTAIPGQPFTVKATAMNGKATPTATTNYTHAGGFAKAINLSLTAGGGTGKLYVDATAGGTAAIPAANFLGSGEGEVLHSAASGRISYIFDSFPTLETAITIHAEDADTVTSAGTDDTTQARSGRLRLVNAYGSELLPARVEYRAEYWGGNRWIANADDTCSGIAATNIATGGLTVNGITGLTNGIGFITFNTAAAGSYDIAINLNSSGSDTSCNTAHGGTAANMPWLQGYWSAPANCGGVAAWAQDPNARIRLGSPRAPYIYLRERY
jgi:MSHA biogenesis protein MshQ